MSLVDLWKSSPEQVRDKQVQQLIAFAGEGILKDGNVASAEFREFLSGVSSSLLHRYAEECLTLRFEGAGFALQDVVNELGRRLGFAVTHGRYRGISSAIGYDGLWAAPEGNKLIIEVKTTDAYRIDLGTVAGYRRELIRQGEIEEDHSSILIVVGRHDTGDLEAQIRGSKHAWDVRLISVDSLLRLLKIKEEVEDPRIESQVRLTLVPREYTRVDGIIDLVFSTTEEIKEDERATEEVKAQARVEKREPRFIPVDFNDACVERIERFLSRNLVRRSRAIFSSPDESVAVTCAVSREYEVGSDKGYWFAFHPHQKEKLEKSSEAYVAFGCGSPDKLPLMPFDKFAPLLSGMNQTHREDGRSYWHVQIYDEGGRLILHRRKGVDWPDITSYLIPPKF